MDRVRGTATRITVDADVLLAVSEPFRSIWLRMLEFDPKLRCSVAEVYNTYQRTGAIPRIPLSRVKQLPASDHMAPPVSVWLGPWQRRAIVDWIYRSCEADDLLPCMALAVYLVDAYAAKCEFDKTVAQNIAAACIMIAAVLVLAEDINILSFVPDSDVALVQKCVADVGSSLDFRLYVDTFDWQIECECGSVDYSAVWEVLRGRKLASKCALDAYHRRLKARGPGLENTESNIAKV